MKYVFAVNNDDGTIKFYMNETDYVNRLVEIDLDLCEESVPKVKIIPEGIMGTPLYFDENISDWCILTVNTPIKFLYRYQVMTNATDALLKVCRDKNKKFIGFDKVLDILHNKLNAIGLNNINDINIFGGLLDEKEIK